MQAAKIEISGDTTFESVWALVKEVAESQKETDRYIKEVAESQKETDRYIKEVAESQKETDRQMKETDRRLKETERLVKENGEQIGGLHNSFGEMAEHLVAPGIARRFNELGYHFDVEVKKGLIIKEQERIKTEIDILLENGECIIAVEVKSRVQADSKHNDISHHIQRLEILRKHRLYDPRKILGAIAGAMFDPGAKEAAIQAGFFVLEQSGETMQMYLPEGFVPLEW